LNTNKIEKELSWGAKIKFDEGFEKTVSWYLENINWVEKKLHILEEYWKTVYVSNK
jgi:dTDP-glucose 4,6-dehydratase